MKGNVNFVSVEETWFSTGDTVGSNEVASWLNNDVVEKKTLAWFVDQINNFDFNTKKTNYIGSGNAHHVFSTGECVFIMCEYDDDEKALLTKEQCIKSLEHYKIFLDGDYKNGVTPDPFEVEYIAEGEEALSQFEKLGGVLQS